MPEEQKKEKTPLEHLQGVAGAPSAARIQEWKDQVPSGRVSLFALPPDGKTVFVLRGLSGFEMLQLQKTLSVRNTENPQQLLELSAASAAVLWTNLTPDGKLDETILQKQGAGLAQSLFMKVSELSYFMTPEQVEIYSGDL